MFIQSFFGGRMMLNRQGIDQIIECLKNGDQIPEGYRDVLFPTLQKEYELTYAGKMRKEDLLANEDGTFPVPLQIEKIFNGTEYEQFEDGWRNMIVFGDNLQFLKTIYENKDPLIKDKVKGKVKLIYIDPPFATTDDFKNKDGAKAYSDKKKGAEFVEFLRRRLILAREILADDGSIFVHLDWKKAHYIKLIMDEVFGENNFLNEIIWYYRRWNIASNMFARNHDTIFYYAKNKGQHTFNNLYIPKSDKSSGNGKSWLSVIDEETGKRRSVLQDEESKGVPMPDVFDISMINPVALERKNINYPTQKPEALLERIIKASTNEGDIVLDFFSGSGTTVATAEKLNRRWIGCDIGKLSYYTTQKRILQIQGSKSLLDNKKKFEKKAKSFSTCTLGLYDLKKALDLEWQSYKLFVSSLFEIEMVKNKIAGLNFDGKKGDYLVKIFDYKMFKNSSIDVDYLKELHSVIGKKVSGRIYIVAPSNYIEFLTDYHEIDDVRYYFLKIPYHIIKELHQKPFQKFRQPRSINNINDLDESIGFHFVRQPEVVSELSQSKDLNLIIKNFTSKELESDKLAEEKSLKCFDTLSAIFIDENYNGKSFQMTNVYFYDELNFVENVGISIPLKVGTENRIMVIYSDIYGNDFTELFSL